MLTESLQEIAEFMAQNGAQCRGQTQMYPIHDRELGDDLDDRDSSYWEDHLGGPDDADIEARDLVFESEGYDEGYELEDSSVSNDPDDPKACEMGDVTAENEQILDWLLSAKLVHPFANGGGFLVTRGPHVKFADGGVADLIDWLVARGFGGGCQIAGYSVVGTRGETGLQEGLSFSKVVVDCPFIRNTQVQGSIDATQFEDDIPF